MKKLLAIILCLGLVFSLSACMAMQKEDLMPDSTEQSGEAAAETTKDQAIDIALEDAKLTREKVRNLQAEADYENGVKVWQVEFDYENTEYSYDINISTGEIVDRDKDLDY